MTTAWYTIFVSNHPDAGQRIQSEEAASSWECIFDGLVDNQRDAIAAADGMTIAWNHVRLLRGKNMGRLLYGTSKNVIPLHGGK